MIHQVGIPPKYVFNLNMHRILSGGPRDVFVLMSGLLPLSENLKKEKATMGPEVKKSFKMPEGFRLSIGSGQ